MKSLLAILVITALIAGTSSFAQLPATRYATASMALDGSGETIVLGSGVSLPFAEYLIELPDSLTAGDFQYAYADPTEAGICENGFSEIMPTTSDRKYRDAILAHTNHELLGHRPVIVHGIFSADGRRYLRITVTPVTVDHDGVLHRYPRVTMTLGDSILTRHDLFRPEDITFMDAVRNDAPGSSQSEHSQYLIICSMAHVTALERLVMYRTAIGYDVSVETIESILGAYQGEDDAAKLRNRLKQFYGDGGRYVLLAGDETLVPVRYAYQYDGSVPPAPDLLIPTDLYFADLTGNWDSDGDGIYGERTEDAPDLIPELMIGRLPLADSSEFAAYIQNLIIYETNPGDGDPGYLTRSLFFSSDQMRDYDGGQHNIIAASFPPHFDIDTSLGVEQSAGNDLSPTNIPADLLAAEIGEGYGIVNVIAHGRNDGFVVRSANYNDWPKQYLLTDADGSSHGALDQLFRPNRPGFYISLACDNGAFDKDQSPFNGGLSMVQQLLGSRDGAVGMWQIRAGAGSVPVICCTRHSSIPSWRTRNDRPSCPCMTRRKSTGTTVTWCTARISSAIRPLNSIPAYRLN